MAYMTRMYRKLDSWKDELKREERIEQIRERLKEDSERESRISSVLGLEHFSSDDASTAG